MNNQEIINLNEHVDTSKMFRTTSQEDTIKTILVREFYANQDIKPKIFIPDLAILGYKKPEKAVKSLINRGVVKDLGNNIIELVTKQVYCQQCGHNAVFIWDREDHLTRAHYWTEEVKKHNVMDLKFSNKPIPEKIDHDFYRISEIKDNNLEVKCKNCGYERTIYIDHYRRECDPFNKGIFIENPDDEENIKVKTYSNHETIVLKNQEELKKFIQSKIEENV